VPPDAVLDTGSFELERAQLNPLWAKELYGFKDHVPETQEYGISSFVYEARAPFHPERLHRFINAPWTGSCAPKASSGWRRVPPMSAS
jgi:G3E family GTPase